MIYHLLNGIYFMSKYYFICQIENIKNNLNKLMYKTLNRNSKNVAKGGRYPSMKLKIVLESGGFRGGRERFPKKI